MTSAFGLYEVLQRVAAGSTGTVYLARHSELGRLAAVKELNASVRTEPGLLERFRGEAEVLAGLDDPHIVAVYDYVEEPDRAWIAEEWVDGSSLQAMLATHGRLTPEQSLGVLHGALTGLAYAHDRGLVHRDIAPTNILADMAGTSKLVDFGLAAPIGQTGACGTPAYVSPEAARGDAVDKRSDVYSAAAVLFTLLVGRPPFPSRDSAEALRHHIEDPAPALDDHGDALRDLTARALDKDPDARPADARAFLNELEQAAEQRYGAGWLARASIAGIVAAGGGTLATAAAGGAAVSQAADTIVVSTAATQTGEAVAQTTAAVASKGKYVGAGLAAAAVVVAVVVFAATRGSTTDVVPASAPGSASPVAASPSASSASPSSTALPAPAFSGQYALTSVVTGNTAPGVFYKLDKALVVGYTSTATWTVTPNCPTGTCAATAKSSSGSTYPFTYKDGVWSGRLVQNVRCVDSNTGKPVKQKSKITVTYRLAPTDPFGASAVPTPSGAATTSSSPSPADAASATPSPASTDGASVAPVPTTSGVAGLTPLPALTGGSSVKYVGCGTTVITRSWTLASIAE